MICISPMAPFGDTAFTWPRLSTRITARIQLSGMPNRRDASAIYPLSGLTGLVAATGADCVFTDAAKTALIEPPVIASTIAVMIKLRTRTPPPSRRERAIVLASVKGKARAPAREMPIGTKGLTDFRSNKGIGCAGRARMASRRLMAAGGAIPQQIECRSLVVGLEQICADRLPEAGIVKRQGDIGARLFPGAFPARANFWADLGAINIAEMDAIVRRVLRISLVDGNQNEFGIERERAETPRDACLGALECADLSHGDVLSIEGWETVQRVGARHW